MKRNLFLLAIAAICLISCKNAQQVDYSAAYLLSLEFIDIPVDTGYSITIYDDEGTVYVPASFQFIRKQYIDIDGKITFDGGLRIRNNMYYDLEQLNGPYRYQALMLKERAQITPFYMLQTLGYPKETYLSAGGVVAKFNYVYIE